MQIKTTASDKNAEQNQGKWFSFRFDFWNVIISTYFRKKENKKFKPWNDDVRGPGCSAPGAQHSETRENSRPRFRVQQKTGTGFFYFIYLNIIFVFHSSANRIVIDLSQSFLFWRRAKQMCAKCSPDEDERCNSKWHNYLHTSSVSFRPTPFSFFQINSLKMNAIQCTHTHTHNQSILPFL